MHSVLLLIENQGNEYGSIEPTKGEFNQEIRTMFGSSMFIHGNDQQCQLPLAGYSSAGLDEGFNSCTGEH
jgi:hypothetical protein